MRGSPCIVKKTQKPRLSLPLPEMNAGNLPISLARKTSKVILPKVTSRALSISPISTRLEPMQWTHRGAKEGLVEVLPAIAPSKSIHRRTNSDRVLRPIGKIAARPPRPSDLFTIKSRSKQASPKQKQELSTCSSDKGLGVSTVLSEFDDKQHIVGFIEAFYAQYGKCPPTHPQMYAFKTVLGSGNSGKVWLATHKLTLRNVAIKVLDTAYLADKCHYAKAMNEIAILKTIENEHIIRLLEVFEDAKNQLNLVFEYAPGGDLLQLLHNKGKLPENEAKVMFRDILEGLLYLHRNHVIHRDLKLDNILLGTNSVKICDFGISRRVEPMEVVRDKSGTPAFLAPEVIAGAGYDGYGSDVWALGVCLYAMVVGMVPFRGYTVKDLQKSILKGAYTLPDFLSPDVADLISGLLQPLPSQRMSLDFIAEHPWVVSCPLPSPVPTHSLDLTSSMQSLGFPKRPSYTDFTHAAVTYFLLSQCM